MNTTGSVIGIVLASVIVAGIASCSKTESESARASAGAQDTSAPAGEAAGPSEDGLEDARQASATTTPDEPASASDHPIAIDPPELDFGQVQLGQKGTGVVRVTNTSDAPVLFANARPSCGCTTSNAPRNKTMEPGESIEVEVAMNVGDTPGQKLVKYVTWNFKGLPSIRTTVRSEAHSFVAFEPMPLDPQKHPDGKLTLRALDGKAFRITKIEPPVAGDIPAEAATEFVLQVSYEAMEERLTDTFTIYTDHPICKSFEARLEGVNWTLPSGLARSRDPNQRMLAWAKQGAARGIERELEAGADIEATDALGNRALIVAAEGGHDEAVSLLIDRSANIEAANKSGQTPLLGAASNGHASTVAFLLSADASLEAADLAGQTALLAATIGGHTDTVALLLEAGGSTEAGDKRSRQPLLHAAARGDVEMVQLLLGAGAAIEARDGTQGTALTLAAGFGNDATVQLLIDSGADLEAADFLGYRALHWAALKGDTARIGVLIDAGATVDAASSREGLTPLMSAARSGSLENLKCLLAAQGSLELIDKRGRSALLWAIRKGTPEKVQSLLHAGASRDIRDAQGDGPVDYADRRSNPEGERIRALLEQAS